MPMKPMPTMPMPTFLAKLVPSAGLWLSVISMVSDGLGPFTGFSGDTLRLTLHSLKCMNRSDVAGNSAGIVRFGQGQLRSLPALPQSADGVDQFAEAAYSVLSDQA